VVRIPKNSSNASVPVLIPPWVELPLNFTVPLGSCVTFVAIAEADVTFQDPRIEPLNLEGIELMLTPGFPAITLVFPTSAPKRRQLPALCSDGHEYRVAGEDQTSIEICNGCSAYCTGDLIRCTTTSPGKYAVGKMLSAVCNPVDPSVTTPSPPGTNPSPPSSDTMDNGTKTEGILILAIIAGCSGFCCCSCCFFCPLAIWRARKKAWVVVHIAIDEGVCADGRNVLAVANELKQQTLKDNESPLKQGLVTSAITSVTLNISPPRAPAVPAPARDAAALAAQPAKSTPAEDPASAVDPAPAPEKDAAPSLPSAVQGVVDYCECECKISDCALVMTLGDTTMWRLVKALYTPRYYFSAIFWKGSVMPCHIKDRFRQQVQQDVAVAVQGLAPKIRIIDIMVSDEHIKEAQVALNLVTIEDIADNVKSSEKPENLVTIEDIADNVKSFEKPDRIDNNQSLSSDSGLLTEKGYEVLQGLQDRIR
jgi:hypothetical protein